MASEKDKAEARKQIRVYETKLNDMNAGLRRCNRAIEDYEKSIEIADKLRDKKFIKQMEKAIKDTKKSRGKLAGHVDELTKRIANLKRIL